MNKLYEPVDYPAEETPGLVDSRAMYIKAIQKGLAKPLPGETIHQSYAAWFNWARFALAYTDDLQVMGISYLILAHDQPTMDFDPGKNRVSLFPDGRSRDYETALLERFDASVGFLGSASVQSLVDNRADIAPPYVLKDTQANKGRGKLLVSDEQKHRRVMNLLRGKKKADLRHLLAEEYCEPPGDYNSTYRITMTPGASIHGAVITRSVSQKDSVKTDWREAGPVLEPLADPDSPYFIDSPRITSNTDGDKSYIGLDFPGRWYDMTRPSEADTQVLEDYGIDWARPVIPEKVLMAAVDVGRVLGPGFGMHIGIDLIQSQDGNLHLLEVNPDPEYTSIFKTLAPGERQPAVDELRELAFRTTIVDLADGVFKQTKVTL